MHGIKYSQLEVATLVIMKLQLCMYIPCMGSSIQSARGCNSGYNETPVVYVYTMHGIKYSQLEVATLVIMKLQLCMYIPCMGSSIQSARGRNSGYNETPVVYVYTMHGIKYSQLEVATLVIMKLQLCMYIP